MFISCSNVTCYLLYKSEYNAYKNARQTYPKESEKEKKCRIKKRYCIHSFSAHMTTVRLVSSFYALTIKECVSLFACYFLFLFLL